MGTTADASRGLLLIGMGYWLKKQPHFQGSELQQQGTGVSHSEQIIGVAILWFFFSSEHRDKHTVEGVTMYDCSTPVWNEKFKQ